MDKKFNVDVNNINLHELEDVISINRDVDIGKHLPQDIIGKGAEFTNIRIRENIELSNLWKKLNSLMENLYIESAGKLGLSAYKKLIDDENIKGDLEEQRKKIYALWNMAKIWTHRTFEEWLDLYLGKENYFISFDYDKYGIEILVNVKESLNLELDDFQKKVRKIIPANLTQFIRIKFIRDQKIFYGMYGQKAKKITIMAVKPEDRVFNLPTYYGIGEVRKRLKRRARMPDVWTVDDVGMMKEIGDGSEVDMKYDR